VFDAERRDSRQNGRVLRRFKRSPIPPWKCETPGTGAPAKYRAFHADSTKRQIPLYDKLSICSRQIVQRFRDVDFILMHLPSFKIFLFEISVFFVSSMFEKARRQVKRGTSPRFPPIPPKTR
jgi:hypothetical protein